MEVQVLEIVSSCIIIYQIRMTTHTKDLILNNTAVLTLLNVSLLLLLKIHGLTLQ
jgi:hypothetical protein